MQDSTIVPANEFTQVKKKGKLNEDLHLVSFSLFLLFSLFFSTASLSSYFPLFF